jgi:hypothetical protein
MDTDTARALMDGALAEPLGLGGERGSLAKNPVMSVFKGHGRQIPPGSFLPG